MECVGAIQELTKILVHSKNIDHLKIYNDVMYSLRTLNN